MLVDFDNDYHCVFLNMLNYNTPGILCVPKKYATQNSFCLSVPMSTDVSSIPFTFKSFVFYYLCFQNT